MRNHDHDYDIRLGKNNRVVFDYQKVLNKETNDKKNDFFSFFIV